MLESAGGVVKRVRGVEVEIVRDGLQSTMLRRSSGGAAGAVTGACAAGLVAAPFNNFKISLSFAFDVARGTISCRMDGAEELGLALSSSETTIAVAEANGAGDVLAKRP